MAKKDKIICKRLKGLLAENCMTVADLAKKMGISESSLTQKILGNRSWWFEETVLAMRIFKAEEVKDVFPELYLSACKSR